MPKNDAQISGFAFVWKAQIPWNKSLKKKKSFQLICVDTIFKTVSRCFLRINQSQDILTFGDFMVSKKLFFTVKLPIKHKQQTIKKTAQLCPKSTHEVSAKQD